MFEELEEEMRDESASASELFLTFLQWARAASEQASEDEFLTGVSLGMQRLARHGSCSATVASEVEHEASVHEL